MDAKLVVLLIILAMICGTVFAVRRKVEDISDSLFGTKSLREGLKRQADMLAETPKSVSGMTRLMEPQIQKDFPEFNWMEFRGRAENMLLSAFLALERQDVGCLKDASDTLKRQVENLIETDRQEGITETYERARIHQTEIARYEKKEGKCVITLQSAVEYLHFCEKEHKVISGDAKRLTQTRYNVELMYIQDAGKISADKSYGMTCPSCGAPITSLGIKHCEYCGLTVTPVNRQVWSLERFYEV